mgnify:CR=1 FL=1
MNKKEISELRRRFKPEKNNISQVHGCYVNGKGEVISYIDESLRTMPQEEAEKYLSLLGKALSGTPGKNLIDIVFSTAQVVDSDEHRRLTGLRDSKLQDGEARQAFYQKVIDSLDMGDSNYLILLAHDSYDVPSRDRNGDKQDDSDTVFSYILCCVCPVKDGKAELGYCPGENEFHNCVPSQLVAQPELGFLFPAFDDRAANIYSALAYSKKADQLHQEFLDAIFHIEEPPMSAGEQRQAFENALVQSMEGGCSLEVVQAVHERLALRIEEHKESKDPEPLAVTAREVGTILRDCGVEEPQVEAFCQSCGRQFGEGAALSPANLIDSKRFQVRTGDATLTLAPDRSYLLETRVIEGRKYLLVPVDGEMEVNGLAVE